MRKIMTLTLIGMLCVVGTANAEVVFKPATTVATDGFKQLTTPTGRFFVASDAVLGEADVLAAQSIRGGSAVALTVPADVNRTLAASTGTYDRLAVFVDGTLITAARFRALGDSLVLSGLTPATGQLIANVIGVTGVDPNAPVMSVVTRGSSVEPGGTITADVFVNNGVDVQVYQALVRATGTVSGRLPASELMIDKSRSDFIFGTAQVIDAVDYTQSRMGALQFTGGVTGGGYLGTFVFQTNAGVNETIYLNLEVGEQSFVTDSNGAVIQHRTGEPAVVAVGVAPQLGTRSIRTSK